MKKKFLRILVLIIGIIAVYYTKSYCVESGSVRMQIKEGGTVWNNIDISSSYAECESLNSASSTLGTTLLKAHLTTDADWSAMAIFSVSQYGGVTSNSPAQTNGNKSGIYNIGTNWTQTTGILSNASATSTAYLSGLFDNGNPKRYIRQWSTNRTQTNFVGFTDTWGWLQGETNWGSSASYPISMKHGLFGVVIGGVDGNKTSGGPYNNVTFRPVIWN